MDRAGEWEEKEVKRRVCSGRVGSVEFAWVQGDEGWVGLILVLDGFRQQARGGSGGGGDSE